MIDQTDVKNLICFLLYIWTFFIKPAACRVEVTISDPSSPKVRFAKWEPRNEEKLLCHYDISSNEGRMNSIEIYKIERKDGRIQKLFYYEMTNDSISDDRWMSVTSEGLEGYCKSRIPKCTLARKLGRKNGLILLKFKDVNSFEFGSYRCAMTTSQQKTFEGEVDVSVCGQYSIRLNKKSNYFPLCEMNTITPDKCDQKCCLQASCDERKSNGYLWKAGSCKVFHCENPTHFDNILYDKKAEGWVSYADSHGICDKFILLHSQEEHWMLNCPVVKKLSMFCGVECCMHQTCMMRTKVFTMKGETCEVRNCTASPELRGVDSFLAFSASGYAIYSKASVLSEQSNGLIAYEHWNFHGTTRNYTTDEDIDRVPELKNKISAIQITGNDSWVVTGKGKFGKPFKAILSYGKYSRKELENYGFVDNSINKVSPSLSVDFLKEKKSARPDYLMLALIPIGVWVLSVGLYFMGIFSRKKKAKAKEKEKTPSIVSEKQEKRKSFDERMQGGMFESDNLQSDVSYGYGVGANETESDTYTSESRASDTECDVFKERVIIPKMSPVISREKRISVQSTQTPNTTRQANDAIYDLTRYGDQWEEFPKTLYPKAISEGTNTSFSTIGIPKTTPEYKISKVEGRLTPEIIEDLKKVSKTTKKSSEEIKNMEYKISKPSSEVSKKPSKTAKKSSEEIKNTENKILSKPSSEVSKKHSKTSKKSSEEIKRTESNILSKPSSEASKKQSTSNSHPPDISKIESNVTSKASGEFGKKFSIASSEASSKLSKTCSKQHVEKLSKACSKQHVETLSKTCSKQHVETSKQDCKSAPNKSKDSLWCRLTRTASIWGKRSRSPDENSVMGCSMDLVPSGISQKAPDQGILIRDRNLMCLPGEGGYGRNPNSPDQNFSKGGYTRNLMQDCGFTKTPSPTDKDDKKDKSKSSEKGGKKNTPKPLEKGGSQMTTTTSSSYEYCSGSSSITSTTSYEEQYPKSAWGKKLQGKDLGKAGKSKWQIGGKLKNKKSEDDWWKNKKLKAKRSEEDTFRDFRVKDKRSREDFERGFKMKNKRSREDADRGYNIKKNRSREDANRDYRIRKNRSREDVCDRDYRISKNRSREDADRGYRIQKNRSREECDMGYRTGKNRSREDADRGYRIQKNISREDANGCYRQRNDRLQTDDSETSYETSTKISDDDTESSYGMRNRITDDNEDSECSYGIRDKRSREFFEKSLPKTKNRTANSKNKRGKSLDSSKMAEDCKIINARHQLGKDVRISFSDIQPPKLREPTTNRWQNVKESVNCTLGLPSPKRPGAAFVNETPEKASALSMVPNARCK